MATIQSPTPAYQQLPIRSEEQTSYQDLSGNTLGGTGQDGEYDPCQNAQKFSPFYMYNHDSPRPSADLRPKQSIHIDVRDLELGDITPSVTQEKINAQAKATSKLDRLKFWQGRKECMTRPKKQWWLQRLPTKQRYLVKALITLLVCGAMVGIAVGIAAALHSGVSGSGKTVGDNEKQ